MESATFDIPEIGSDPEEVTPDAEGLKDTWIETIGNIGSTVASAEVEEAANTPSKVPSGTVSSALLLLTLGDSQNSLAVANRDADALLLALGFYSDAFDAVVSLLHPACAVGGIAELPDADAAPAQASDSSGTSTGIIAGLVAGAVAVGVAALGGAAWFRRRRLR